MNTISTLLENIYKRKIEIKEKLLKKPDSFNKLQLLKKSYYYDSGYFGGIEINMGILNPDTPEEEIVYNTLFYKVITLNIPEYYLPFLEINILTNKSCNFDLKTTSIYNSGMVANTDDYYQCTVPTNNYVLTGINNGSAITIKGEYFITKITDDQFIVDIFTVTEKTEGLQLKYIITVGNLI